MFAKLHLTILAISAIAAAQTRYYIRNAQSKLVLDVRASSKQSGADVILWTTNSPPAANQLWYVEDRGHITNVNSGLVLQAPFDASGRLNAGALLQQANDTGEANQQWFRDSTGRIISVYNQNLAIWGQGGNVHDQGTRAVADYKVNNDASQVWNLDPA